MKKILSAVLTAVIIALCCPAYAASEFPHSFWAVDNQYQAARNANDYSGIIKYANQSIDICRGMAESQSKHNVITSRYGEMGKAYFALGDYESSARTYYTLYDYESGLGSDYAERAKIAYKKAQQYMPAMDLYTDSGEPVYYGAKNESTGGVLFGLCSNGETRSKLGNESMVLVYQELGETLLPYNTNIIKKASSEKLAVEFALNCPNEAGDIQNIRNKTSYLREISDMLAEYDNIPVFLRFGAEFDVWSNIADSEEYKSAFRYVSDYFKSRNSNVAIVWSPNQASNWNVDIKDYYPGDEYVDWVGVSSYAKKYPNTGGDPVEDALFFKNGINSEPVITLEDIIEEYGDRKPIMLSESGCGHHVMNNGKTGEDTTDFALRRIKEYYGYLPMVYPQIKLIAYFDHYVNGWSETSDYRLSTSPALQNEYLRLTKGDRFIQDNCYGSAPLNYRLIYEGRHLNSAFLLACYARKYNNETEKVTYFIDDKYVGMSEEIPFSTYVNAADYSGYHTVKAVAKFADGSTMTREFGVQIASSGGDIAVEIDGRTVDFDQKPVIYNDRTMVPMRKIFEKLNADVDWDASTGTVTGTRGDRAVKVTIGERKMYINHKEVQLDTAPFILGGRTLVPVRAVSEGLGCEVDWYGSSRLVSITPKVFEWSDWETSLPSGVDEDLYYIEKKTQHRTRTRTRYKDYYTTSDKLAFGNYVGTNVIYGNWSDWQDDYISETSSREVDTRTVSSPVSYTYYHWCTGYNDDESLSYKTSDRQFTDIAIYHELGTYDYRLPEADDGNGGQVLYLDDGSSYRCSNSCFRWHERVNGGSYTQYRSRSVKYEYEYWKWSDWSDWSSWSGWKDGDFRASDYTLDDTEGITSDTRTLYRYKEK